MADTIELVAGATSSARFSLRIPPDVAKQIGSAARFALGSAINTCVTAGDRMSIRLGPDEWLLLAPAADRESARKEIEAALESTFFSLVDTCDARLAFTVNGMHAADVLNAGCPLDLDDAAFPAGSATRTLLGKAEIILVRPTYERSYYLECARSFEPYVQAFLKDAALEFIAE